MEKKIYMYVLHVSNSKSCITIFEKPEHLYSPKDLSIWLWHHRWLKKDVSQAEHQKSGVKTNSGCNTPSNH